MNAILNISDTTRNSTLKDLFHGVCVASGGIVMGQPVQGMPLQQPNVSMMATGQPLVCPSFLYISK